MNSRIDPSGIACGARVRRGRGQARGNGSRAGFSLVEVMAAVLILGVGLVGLTEGLATALRSTKESELQTTAMIYASGLIETLRAEGYITDGETEGECTPVLEACRWRRRISRAELDGLHEVSVVIENRQSGKQVCELQTLLFEVPSDVVVKDREKQKERDAAARKREGGAGGGPGAGERRGR